MTTVINLYGGPGIGKSTLAAKLYAEMAVQKYNVELVREYVKDWAWAGRKIGKYDQMYFLVQQFKREAILYNKVDYIITDSPFTLAAFYAEHYLGQSFLTNSALAMRKLAEEDGIIFKDFVVIRSTTYEATGRYETEDQAKELDQKIELYLANNNIKYSLLNNNYLDLLKELK